MSGGPGRRVRQTHIDWLGTRLLERDWRIIAELSRTRLLTSYQLERLCFTNLSGRSRRVVRARVLKRLRDWRMLVMLPRQVGGRGSAAAVYCLDSAGLAVAQLHEQAPRRRVGLPGERFVRHALTVSELYVSLTETARRGMLALLFLRTLDLLNDPAGLYQQGNETVRSILNWAFFTKLYVDGRNACVTEHELREPFDVLSGTYQLYQDQAGTRIYQRRTSLQTHYSAAHDDVICAVDEREELISSLVATLTGQVSSTSVLVGATGFEPVTPRL